MQSTQSDKYTLHAVLSGQRGGTPHTAGDTLGYTQQGTHWATHCRGHTGLHTAGDTLGYTLQGTHWATHCRGHIGLHTAGDTLGYTLQGTHWATHSSTGSGEDLFLASQTSVTHRFIRILINELTDVITRFLSAGFVLLLWLIYPSYGNEISVSTLTNPGGVERTKPLPFLDSRGLNTLTV
jgi:hypothetical protein